MKNLIAIIVSVVTCLLLIVIFLSNETSLLKDVLPHNSRTKESSSHDSLGGDSAVTSPSISVTDDLMQSYATSSYDETDLESELIIPEPSAAEESVTTVETGMQTTDFQTHTSEVTEPVTAESEISLPISETEPPYVSETSDSTEMSAESEMHEPHEIIRTADQSGWRYAIRSFELLDELPQGISLSDTTQAFGSFDTYDESGLAVSRGDSVASHLSDSGKYDGYLGKEYVWAVLNFDLTNLTGKDDYIIVGDLHLSFGKYKKVIYMGKERYRYEHSVEIGYMNMHDVMPDIPKDMQYFTLHFDTDETKQLVFCYLIEKKYSDEEFYLEMNIHNDGESYGFLSLSEA